MTEIKQTELFKKWERKLKDKRAKAAIAARIFRLANGLPGDVAPIGQGISELRIHYGPGFRIYFKEQDNALILLLSAGNKNTQKRDITTAKQLEGALES